MGMFQPLVVFLLLSNSPSTRTFEHPLLPADTPSITNESFTHPKDQMPHVEKRKGEISATPILTIQEDLRRFRRSSNEYNEPYNIHQDLDLASNASLKDLIYTAEKALCGNVCDSDFPTASVRLNEYGLCQMCQCDATCVRNNNCCPDVYLFKNITPSLPAAECILMSPTQFSATDWIFGDPNPSVTRHASSITSCPTNGLISNGTEEITQLRKCEEPNVSNMDEAVPVFDVNTNLTYMNVYCAKCNNVSSSNTKQWGIEINCAKPLGYDYSILSKMEMYRFLITRAGVKKTLCHVTYVSPKRWPCRSGEGQLKKSCHASYKSSPWYNADIERACLMYTSLFDKQYQNVFCYMCGKEFNSINSTLVRILNSKLFAANIARLSFAALIDFTSDHSADDNEDAQNDVNALGPSCSSSQFFDNGTCSCKDILCDQWRIYSPESNQCQIGLGDLGVAYQACLRVNVEFETPPDFHVIKSLRDQFTAFEVARKLKVTVSKWCPGDQTLILHLDIVAIDEGKHSVSSYLYENLFDKEATRFCTFLLSHEVHLDTLDNTSLKSCTFDMVSGRECLSSSERSLPCIHDNVTYVGTTNLINTTRHYKAIVNRTRNFKYFYNQYNTIDYKRTDHCPFVEVSNREFNETEDKLIHHASLQTINIWKTQIETNKSVRMCQNDYLQWSQSDGTQCEIYKSKYSSNISFDTWTAAGLISIASSCFSLFFLFLTLLTYLLFSQIRTPGCQNLIILTVILFIAQALYEFAIEQYENKTLCRIFGVLIHYFWLASLFAMNACTIERFIKLYFPLKSRSIFASKKPIIIASLYIFLCPLLIVICNIAANVVLKNEFGYGSAQICYINERYSRIFSFVLPMCVILVVNVVLLIITIVNLRQQTTALELRSSVAASRIGLIACVRLSVVTGGTWLISLMYEAIPVEALGYIFTALLGLQGVIFFFSLLGNRRILEMYINLLKTRSTKPPKSVSSSSTIVRKRNAAAISNVEPGGTIGTGKTKAHTSVTSGVTQFTELA